MPSMDYAELTTNRVQSDACIDYAEVRADGVASGEPSLLGLYRVTTEGNKS